MMPLTLAVTRPNRPVGIRIRLVQLFGTVSAASSGPGTLVIGRLRSAAVGPGRSSEQAAAASDRSTRAAGAAGRLRNLTDSSGSVYIESSSKKGIQGGPTVPARSGSLDAWDGGECGQSLASLRPRR